MTEDWKRREQKYKKIWKDEPERFAGVEQLLKKMEFSSSEERVLAETTIYVMAPLLCAYVAWVLREAAASGKKRLYFLARDGYYMKKIAEILCKAWNLDIECRYLYCSRYVWRGAVYYMDTEAALDYITIGGLEADINKIMQRTGLSTNEIKQVADELGYDLTAKERLAFAERQQLCRELSGCGMFMQNLKEHSQEMYQKTIAYLVQEGLLDKTPYALVDSGWTGSLQKSLSMLLRSVGCENLPEGYYFGMYSRPKEEAGAYHTFYFSPTTHIRRKVYFNNNVFESVYSAPHGMTVGFEIQERKIEPVLEQKKNPNEHRLMFAEPIFITYALDFAAVYKRRKENGEAEKLCGTEQRRLEKLIRLFMGRPTREEAQAYGNYVFCDDVIGEGQQLLAGRLNKEELKNGFLGTKIRNKIGEWCGGSVKIGRESAWLEGSVALVLGKNGFWHCALCGYVRAILESWKNRRQGR